MSGATVVVTIPGEPVAQGRPRFSTRGGFPRAFDPPKSRSWKAEARAAMVVAVVEGQSVYRSGSLAFPKGVPLNVSVLAVFSRPKSAGKKPGRLLKVTRPDAENVAKAVLDAGTGVLWADDSQVVDLAVSKRHGAPDEAPFVLLEVTAA